jgi:hypothetical protein
MALVVAILQRFFTTTIEAINAVAALLIRKGPVDADP